MRQGPVLLHVAAAADPVVCDGQVEDQAPAARCIPEVAPDLHVAAPLAILFVPQRHGLSRTSNRLKLGTMGQCPADEKEERAEKVW